MTAGAARHRQNRWQLAVKELEAYLRALDLGVVETSSDQVVLSIIWGAGYRAVELIERGETFQFEMAANFGPRIHVHVEKTLTQLDAISAWLQLMYRRYGGTEYYAKRFPQYRRKERKDEEQTRRPRQGFRKRF